MGRAKSGRRPGASRKSRGARFGIAAAGLGLAAAAVLVARSLSPVPPIPDPDTSAMEAQVAEKIASTRRLVRESPREAQRWGELGMVFHAHDLLREADAGYEQAQRLDSADPRWPYLRARALKDVQEIDAALARAREALALAPERAALHVLAAGLHEQRGDEASAAEAYRRALELEPATAAAAFGLGRLMLTAGRLDESREWLERAKQLQPDAGAVRASLARLYQRLGEGEPARSEALAARALHPLVALEDPWMEAVAEEAVSVVGLQKRAIAAEHRGEAQRAEVLLRRMIELRPEDADLYYNLANHLARRGRVEEALPLFEEALAREPDHAPALVNLGNVHSQRGERDRARRLFERALQAEPDHPGALSSLGKTAALEGDLARAIDLLERSASRDPRRPDTHYTLAQMFRLAGRPSDAVTALERAIALSHGPAAGELRLELARAYADAGRLLEARDQVELAESEGFTAPLELRPLLRPVQGPP